MNNFEVDMQLCTVNPTLVIVSSRRPVSFFFRYRYFKRAIAVFHLVFHTMHVRH